VWIDHTGRGAVEISNCGGSLCGKIVWLKDSAHNETCGKQVIGNVKPVGAGKWDNGWIYDVDEDRALRRRDHPHGRSPEGDGLHGQQVPERDHDLAPRAGGFEAL
jgi:hypothetical protein